MSTTLEAKNAAKITVPLLDLKAQWAAVKDDVMKAVAAVFESQQFILGPAVQECEKRIAEYCRAAHAIGVTSGTDALVIALMAEGIGPGDEVITTPYTFFATAGSIARLGAKPVFVDICPRTYNIKVSEIEAKITARTKAIIPVHLYGQCADMDPILDIAKRRKLVVIEDAAQAIGSEYKGRRAGSMGDYGCFSFFPSKNLGCAGDGGMVTAQDAAKAEKVRILRAHGSKPKYFHKIIGGNFRLDSIQAAVVTAKLPLLDSWSSGRQSNADRYRRLFGQTAAVRDGLVHLPYAVPDGRHIYNQFIIRVPKRDELQGYLKDQGIGTEVYYPVPMHTQECFAYLGHKAGDLPEAERAAKETLALPIYPELSDVQAEYVVDCIAKFYA
jgi:dTDP-4-amino-4,6-dideoxygalactose transaminase